MYNVIYRDCTYHGSDNEKLEVFQSFIHYITPNNYLLSMFNIFFIEFVYYIMLIHYLGIRINYVVICLFFFYLTIDL